MAADLAVARPLTLEFGFPAGCTRVQIHGKPIGLIQSVQCHAEAGDFYPTVEIQFVKLPAGSSKSLRGSLARYVKLAKSIPFVKVIE